MILHASKNAQLSLDRNAQRMGISNHLSGQFNILLIGKTAAVDHHGGITPLNASLDHLKTPAVIQVKGNGNRTLLTEIPDNVSHILCALFLALYGSMHEIDFSAHKGVGSLRPLQDTGALQELMDLHGGSDLTEAVHIEGRLTVPLAVRRL